MDWCSVYLISQRLPKYIYLSPPLIFPTTSTELGQKTARCESLRALLQYVEWDRIVTLAGANADWGLRYRTSIHGRLISIWKFECMRSSFCPTFVYKLLFHVYLPRFGDILINRPVWITPGAAPIRWMGPNRNPRWSKRGLRVTFSYLIRCIMDRLP
jgi:hypothetical protein